MSDNENETLVRLMKTFRRNIFRVDFYLFIFLNIKNDERNTQFDKIYEMFPEL